MYKSIWSPYRCMSLSHWKQCTTVIIYGFRSQRQNPTYERSQHQPTSVENSAERSKISRKRSVARAIKFWQINQNTIFRGMLCLLGLNLRKNQIAVLNFLFLFALIFIYMNLVQDFEFMLQVKIHQNPFSGSRALEHVLANLRQVQLSL